MNDLLDVSRIQTGKLVLRVEPIDLAELARDVVEEQRIASPSRVISSPCPSGPVTVHADADRIRQVITNYVNNAVKYSAETESVEVRLARKARGAPERARPWPRHPRRGICADLGTFPPRRGDRAPQRLRRWAGPRPLHQPRDRRSPRRRRRRRERAGAGSTFWFTLPLT